MINWHCLQIKLADIAMDDTIRIIRTDIMDIGIAGAAVVVIRPCVSYAVVSSVSQGSA